MDALQIRYINPFSLTKNIGAEYNKCISETPDDCYIVLRDLDTMFLTPDCGNRIEQIILNNPDFDIIGCMTNRVGDPRLCVPGMFDEPDIGKHIAKAEEMTGHDVIPIDYIAGYFMLFHKRVWEQVKFKENTILFDGFFCMDARGRFNIGLAIGLYIFHAYRWGKENPKSHKLHLLRNPEK